MRSVNSPKPDADKLSATDARTSKAAETQSTLIPSSNAVPSPTRSPNQRRPPQELRSSIASNLATARGIPSTQQRGARQASSTLATRSPAQTALEKNISPNRSTSRESDELARSTVANANKDVMHTIDPQDINASHDARMHSQPTQSDAFQKFYSSFEGLFTKLSAPLAFSGLPLTQTDEPKITEEAISDPGRATTSSTNLDLNEHFSRAALNAIRNGQDQRGAVNDSFFVVPTSGGTISYARMLSREERRAREQAGDTVDTQEHPQLPDQPDKGNRLSEISRKTNKTVEELEIENDSLKKLTDKLSDRLHKWELSSQRQTTALQQSMRLMHQNPTDSASGGRGTENDNKRIKELEKKVLSMHEEIQKQKNDNEKLKATLKKYRDRWEQLKVGARTRRDSSNHGKGQDE